MIGYVTLGTNDLHRGARFYDALAKELGVGRMMDFDTFIAWGAPGGAPGIGLTKPFNGEAATVGNGVMVALEAKSKEQVHKLHEIALANGGTCEGPPGLFPRSRRQQAERLLDDLTVGRGGDVKTRHDAHETQQRQRIRDHVPLLVRSPFDPQGVERSAGGSPSRELVEYWQRMRLGDVFPPGAPAMVF